METIDLNSFTVKSLQTFSMHLLSSTADTLANLPCHTYRMSSSNEFFFYYELQIEHFCELKTTEICSRTVQLILLLYNRQTISFPTNQKERNRKQRAGLFHRHQCIASLHCTCTNCNGKKLIIEMVLCFWNVTHFESITCERCMKFERCVSIYYLYLILKTHRVHFNSFTVRKLRKENWKLTPFIVFPNNKLVQSSDSI